MSVDQAVAGGVAAGAAEIFFEKFSVDNLLKPRTVSGWRSWVKETLKQGGVEASEEMATEIANILSDAAIMGQKSEFNQSVQAYMDKENMSKEEAERRAFLDCVGQVALAGAGGFVSGGLMGGSVQGYNLHQYNQQSAEIGSQYSDKDLGRLYQENVAAGQAKTQKTASKEETVKADTSLFKKSILQNLNQARSSFIEFARQHFPTSVKNAETGREIGISRTGLDKFLSGRIPYEKYASGFHIPELIERAHKVAQATNEHSGQADSIPTYEYYDSPIDIDGTAYMAHIRVRNTRMGDKYYGHTISEVEDIKIEPSARTSAPGKNPAVQPVNAIDGSTNSISQTAQDVNLKGRSLGDRVADATKRTLEEMARTEKKARFLKESKPLRDRLAQIQAEGEAGLAQTRAQYEKAVADREPGMTETRTETGAKTEADKGKAKPSNMIDLEGELGDRMRRGLKSAIGARKIVGFDGLPEGYRQGFLAGVPNAAPEVRTLLEREAKKADYYVSRGKKSYYRGVSDVIRLSEKSPSSTLAHELFHRIDVRKSISQKLSEAIMQDCVALNVAGGNNVKKYLAQRYPRAFSGMSLDGEMTMGEAYRGIADILNGMSGGKVNFGYGHRKAYWAESGTLEAEAWAQFGRVLYNNDQEVLKMFKELFPNFSRDAILALKELI